MGIQVVVIEQGSNMKRTQEEILARIEKVKAYDWIGTITNDLILWLTLENVSGMLAKPLTEQEWAEVQAKNVPPLEQIAGYLPFAWGKANDCRGLSAGRSLDHMKAWLWLADYEDDVIDLLSDYDYYGKPQLVFCSVLAGFPWPTSDDGRWVTSEDASALNPNERTALVAEWTAKAKALKVPA